MELHQNDQRLVYVDVLCMVRWYVYALGSYLMSQDATRSYNDDGRDDYK
jgi:hypothetical protein